MIPTTGQAREVGGREEKKEGQVHNTKRGKREKGRKREVNNKKVSSELEELGRRNERAERCQGEKKKKNE